MIGVLSMELPEEDQQRLANMANDAVRAIHAVLSEAAAQPGDVDNEAINRRMFDAAMDELLKAYALGAVRANRDSTSMTFETGDS